jgi:hypothetical protein
LHNNKYDDVLFVNRFIDELKLDIRNAILLHKSRTVDAAASLAFMQADLLEASQRRFLTRPSKGFSKYHDKLSTSNAPAAAQSILGTTPAEAKSNAKAKVEDKTTVSMTLRRKMGLCMKCGERWSKGHKCPATVPLHVLEELFQTFQVDTASTCSGDGLDREEDELLTLSQCAAVGIQGRKTVRLHGRIHKQEILILVDSGSSATFISNKAVDQLKLPTESRARSPSYSG